MRISNYPAIKIIKTFTADELNEFSLFISSPFFNPNKKLIELYKEIFKYFPNFDNDKLTKKNLYQAIYKGKEFNYNSLRSVLSGLKLLAERFIETKYIQQKNNKCDLVSAFIERGIEELSERYFSKPKRNYNKAFDSESLYLQSEVLIQEINTDITNNNLKARKRLERIDIKIDKLMHLDFSAYYYRFVTHFTHLLIFYSKYNIDIKKKPVYKMMMNISNSQSNKTIQNYKDPYLCLYKFLLASYLDLLNKEISAKSFRNYTKLFNELSATMSSNEISLHLIRQMSFLIIKLKKDNKESFHDDELFNIYNLILEKKYFMSLTGRYITPDLFISILLHSIKIKKLEWSGYFINNYTSYLKKEHWKILKTFSEAYLEFFKGNIQLSESLLEKFRFYQKKSNASIVKLKEYENDLQLLIYFENGNFQQAEILVHAYREHIRISKSLSVERKEIKMRFLNYYQRLLRIKEMNNDYKAFLTIRELEADKNFFYKNWILEKLKNYGLVKRMAV